MLEEELRERLERCVREETDRYVHSLHVGQLVLRAVERASPPDTNTSSIEFMALVARVLTLPAFSRYVPVVDAWLPHPVVKAILNDAMLVACNARLMLRTEPEQGGWEEWMDSM